MQEQQPMSSASAGNVPHPSTPPATKPARNLYEPYVTPRWFWICLSLFARLVFSITLNLKLVGRENIPEKGPYFVVSNHLYWTDVPLVPAYMPHQVIYLAKKELFEGRNGWMIRFLGAIPVKRGEADRQLLRASDQLLKQGKILVIFPEGTRSKIHQLNPAHAGMGMIALRAGVPVLPVAVCGSEYVFKKFRPRVTVSYGKPILLQPKGEKITKNDINEATETVMRCIAEMLPESYRGIYGKKAEAEEKTASPE